MNVKQIKKALECCMKGNNCGGCCPYDDEDDTCEECTSKLAKDALDLIKVQQAEIERLKQLPTHITVDKTAFEECCYNIETAKAEAYQEFAERLDKEAYYSHGEECAIIELEDVRNVLKELTEDNA